MRVPHHTSVPCRINKAAERREIPWFAKSGICLVARGDPAAMGKWYNYTPRQFEGNRGEWRVWRNWRVCVWLRVVKANVVKEVSCDGMEGMV